MGYEQVECNAARRRRMGKTRPSGNAIIDPMVAMEPRMFLGLYLRGRRSRQRAGTKGMKGAAIRNAKSMRITNPEDISP